MKYFVYCRKSTDAEDRQVLSLESQLSEANKLVDRLPGVQIIRIYEEAMSAKTPGRPLFDEMIKRVEQGEAHGIISWHPDRLARNPIDGGRVIHMIDCGKLKDLQFATFTFANNPQGKLMLSMLFGFSKYYVDSLAENIRRGNRTKAEKGWRPSKPPLGYLTDPTTKVTIPDPARFDLVRQILRLALTGAYTPSRILRIATDEWGLRTRPRPRGGDRFLHLSTIYAILKNPFYAGIFKWDGKVLRGKHAPMITLAEREQIASILSRARKPRPVRRSFAFTGLMRCGSCGLAVTAEEKKNRYGYQYIYYHCTRRKQSTYCREKCVTADELEKQVVAFLGTLRIAEMTRGWLASTFPARDPDTEVEREAQRRALEETIGRLDRELTNLTGLRLREMIDDEGFLRQRQELTERRLALLEKKESFKKQVEWIEPLELFVSFSNKAVDCFLRGDHDQKRLILETVGSNLVLKDKVLSIEARKPFVQRGANATVLQLCSTVQDVRTFLESEDKDFAEMLSKIKQILRQDERNVLVASSSPILPSSPPSPHVHPTASTPPQE